MILSSITCLLYTSKQIEKKLDEESVSESSECPSSLIISPSLLPEYSPEYTFDSFVVGHSNDLAYNIDVYKRQGYVLLVKDPSRVFVGTSSDFKSGQMGMKIFDMAEKENAVAVINAGEFADPGGQGTGNNPMAVSYTHLDVYKRQPQLRLFLQQPDIRKKS